MVELSVYKYKSIRLSHWAVERLKWGSDSESGLWTPDVFKRLNTDLFIQSQLLWNVEINKGRLDKDLEYKDTT